MKRTLSAAITALALVGTAAAAPVTYTFTVGGFAEGATATGTVTAQDVNGDGFLEGGLFFGDEVTDASISFSGNSEVAAFAFGLENLDGFVFDLNSDQVIGNDFTSVVEGFQFFGDGITFAVGLGPGAGDCDGNLGCIVITGLAGITLSSEQVVLVEVAAVPLPAALPLFGAALVGASAARRRRRV